MFAVAVAFVVGTALGSLITHLVLAVVMSLLGARLDTRALRVIDVISGIGLIAFGGVLAHRTLMSPAPS